MRFVATAVSKEQGEVMRDGKLTPAEITIVTADTLTPVAARYAAASIADKFTQPA